MEKPRPITIEDYNAKNIKDLHNACIRPTEKAPFLATVLMRDEDLDHTPIPLKEYSPTWYWYS